MENSRNKEMVMAYLELNEAIYEVNQIKPDKFEVKDISVPCNKDIFYLEIKDGRITCDEQDCIENAKSVCDKDDYVRQAYLNNFECEWYHAWNMTDDLQWNRKLHDDEWEFVEGRYAEGKYLLVNGSVCISDWLTDNGEYDDQCRKIIEAYYESVEAFHEAYEDEAMRKQVLAEMLFEETPYFELSWKMVDEDKIEDAIEKKKEELEKVI